MKIIEVLAHGPDEDEHFSDHMNHLFAVKGKQGWLKPVTSFGDINLITAGDWPPQFHSNFFFVVNGRPIGFANLRRGGRDGEDERYAVTMIYIEPEYRRRHIAMTFYKFLMMNGIELKPDAKYSAGGAAIWDKLRSRPVDEAGVSR